MLGLLSPSMLVLSPNEPTMKDDGGANGADAQGAGGVPWRTSLLTRRDAKNGAQLGPPSSGPEACEHQGLLALSAVVPTLVK